VTDWIEATRAGVRIRVRVQTRASRTGVAGRYGDAIRVRVAAPPVEGAANDELVRLLAKRLGVPASAISIRAGAGSRSKLVDVSGVTVDAARRALETG